MKRYCLLTLLVLAVATSSSSESFRGETCGGMWYGEDVAAHFVDDTFLDEPTWNNLVIDNPPLSTARACKIATEYVTSTKADSLEYRVTEISITRYFDTPHWYYRVHFDSVIAEGDRSWQDMDPYRDLLEIGQYPANTNVPPRLDVFILMSGKVMPVKRFSDIKYESQHAP